ncbi:hypothetical protein [Dokdonella soli]|uniref:Uncharacterized protein n=1 Tax=Dokdonella soli TaxID=529810 RepID=A0ABN1IEF4_9GAMM
MIAPGTPQTVSDGATARFTLTPAAGRVIGAVNGYGGGLGGTTRDCPVSAVFAPGEVIFKDGFDGANP